MVNTGSTWHMKSLKIERPLQRRLLKNLYCIVGRGENVGFWHFLIISRLLTIRNEFKHYRHVFFSPLTSAEICEKSSLWPWKESCASIYSIICRVQVLLIFLKSKTCLSGKSQRFNGKLHRHTRQLLPIKLRKCVPFAFSETTNTLMHVQIIQILVFIKAQF